MAYEDKHPETLADIETYAFHAINDIVDLQDRLRANAARLGVDGAFLATAADMLDDVIHDELVGPMVAARTALESGIPQASVVTYHREIAHAAE